MRNAGIAGPLVLIIIGFLFLVNNFGVHLPFGYVIREFWPLILMIIGALRIAESMSLGPARMHGALTGGVLMLVIGSLFLLQNLTSVGFGRTWPIILITVGVLSFLRFSNSASAGGRGGWR